MRADFRIHSEGQPEVSVAEGNALISIEVPVGRAAGTAVALMNFLELAGHKTRWFSGDGEELVPASKVFADVTPGQHLKGLRGKEELSQEEFAERIGLPLKMVQEFESGKKKISRSMAKRIGEEFKVPYTMFLRSV